MTLSSTQAAPPAGTVERGERAPDIDVRRALALGAAAEVWSQWAQAKRWNWAWLVVAGCAIVHVFDGETGALIPGPTGDFLAFPSSATGGVRVASADANGAGIADIIISKQRNGPTGDVHLTFLGEYTKFENYLPDAYGAGSFG